MDPALRAEALVRFLLDRQPSTEEEEQFNSVGFDCDTFLIKLLCSDEAAERYGDVTQHFISHIRVESSNDVLPHKQAHDLALAQEDLTKLQSGLDRLSGPMIELLKHEERIAKLFDAVRGVQEDVNSLRGRMQQIETSILRSLGASSDC